MLRQFRYGICLIALCGCDSTKEASPRLADPSKEDPRLKAVGVNGPPAKPLAVQEPKSIPKPPNFDK